MGPVEKSKVKRHLLTKEPERRGSRYHESAFGTFPAFSGFRPDVVYLLGMPLFPIPIMQGIVLPSPKRAGSRGACERTELPENTTKASGF